MIHLTVRMSESDRFDRVLRICGRRLRVATPEEDVGLRVEVRNALEERVRLAKNFPWAVDRACAYYRNAYRRGSR